MHLIQILLPIHDNSQQAFPADEYLRVRKELTQHFGGLTVYTRAPAEGMWKLSESHTSEEDIVIFEVMAADLDTSWWARYRHELEARFRQNLIMIRAQQTQLL